MVLRAVASGSGLVGRRGTGYRGGIIGGGGSTPFDPANEPSIIMWVSGDNEDNTTTALSVDFDPADVDTSTNKITMTLPAGFTRTSPYEASLCRFTTTGALPTPLTLNKDYVFQDNGDGTATIYPVVTDEDYALIPSYIEGESLHPLQAYACQAAAINFTDQGTGVHTLVTEPILTQITDKTGNGFNFVPRSSTKSSLRLLTDEDGFKYIEKPGALGRSDNNDDAYGKLMDETLDNATAGALWANKRYMYSVTVARMKFNVHLSMARAFLTPDRVNAATGVITANAHGFATGQKALVGAISDGGAFPTPTVAFAADIYFRSVNSNTFTLHPTALDATNNTNKYVFSDTGTGVFYALDNTRVQSEACTRQMLYDLCSVQNSHDFAPSTNVYQRSLECTSSFFLTGGNNGLLNQTFRAANVGRNWTVLKVKVLVPSGTVAPICNDEATRLTSGEYWITAQGNDSVRLHRSPEAANDSYGINASSLSDAQVIKYDLTGCSGYIQIHAADTAIFRQFNDAFVPPSNIPLITFGDYGVWVAIQDYTNKTYTNGFNSLNNILDAAVYTGSAALTASATSNINNGNADEPHVPGFVDERETIIGVKDTDPASVVSNIMAWLEEKYSTSL